MAIFKEEVIGKKIKIISSQMESLVGQEGNIIDESQETLTLLINKKKEIKVLKRSLLEIEIADEKMTGKNLLARPHDRIKG